MAELPQPGKLKECEIPVLSSRGCSHSLQCFLCRCGAFEPSLDLAWQWPWRGSAGQPQRLPMSPEATCSPCGSTALLKALCACVAKLSAVYFSKKMTRVQSSGKLLIILLSPEEFLLYSMQFPKLECCISKN